jgi:hypothetical protein
VGIYRATWPINASWLLLLRAGLYLDLFAYHEDTGAGGLVDGLMHNVLMVVAEPVDLGEKVWM